MNTRLVLDIWKIALLPPKRRIHCGVASATSIAPAPHPVDHSAAHTGAAAVSTALMTGYQHGG